MNKFRKAIRHCKKNINESPTNSMGGVYALNAPGFRVGDRDKELVFYPDSEGNFPSGIPGQAGSQSYTRPEGFWSGGSEWDQTLVPDASQEFLINDPTGKDTSDLIAEDGTVKTFLPPDSRSFILGPLVDGYVFNHGSDNFTNIGYIQKDTRQFVLLARTQGQITANLHTEGGRVWDGTAEQLTIYNASFTLAMAEWFRDKILEGSFTNNVPYFYSGGVPQQPISGGPSCPNCPPNMFGGVTPGTGGGFGSGGDPNIGTQQGPPTSGNQDAAGGPFPGANPGENGGGEGEGGETDTPLPPPEDEPQKPKGSLLQGFATIDNTMTADIGMSLAMSAFAALAWIVSKLIDLGSAVVGGLVEQYSWTPDEIRSLNNYANERARSMAQTLSVELSNDEWEKQAEKGRQADQQAAKESSDRLRDADKANDNATTPEEKARTQEALDNAIKNKKRVTDNNTKNNRQRAKERIERGLRPKGGQGSQAERKQTDKFSESLKTVKRLISEQEVVQDTQTQDTPSGTEFTGGGRVESATSLNPTMVWFKGENVHFVGGFVGGRASDGINAIDKMFKGTNISSSRVMSLYQTKNNLTKERDAAYVVANDYYTNVAGPNIRKLLDQIRNNLNQPGDYTWGDFYRDRALGDKIDDYWRKWDAYNNNAMSLSMSVLGANKALGTYAMSGRLLTQQEKDPFSLDDPTVGSEKDAKDKDEQIANLIQQLQQETDEYKQAAAMARLKALGWGALLAGGVVLGAIVLAKPAIIGAIGLGTVRILKSFIKSKPPIRPTTIKYPTTPKSSSTGPWTSSSYNPNKPGGGPARKRFPVGDSYEPDRRKRILSEIRKPVEIKKGPTKFKMNFSGKFSAQNTPDKTASQQSDALELRANKNGQRWRQSDKYWSGYETTEKMNVIHDRVGHGQQAWEKIVESSREKNGWRNREIQEELNKIAHEKAMLKENPSYDSPFHDAGIDTNPTTLKNKKNFDKVNKIKNVMADKKTEKMASQIAPEYPSSPVPQPDEVTNLHPKLQSGERASAYYKRLDPISADSMPDAAYPQINDFKNKARKKPK